MEKTSVKKLLKTLTKNHKGLLISITKDGRQTRFASAKAKFEIPEDMKPDIFWSKVSFEDYFLVFEFEDNKFSLQSLAKAERIDVSINEEGMSKLEIMF